MAVGEGWLVSWLYTCLKVVQFTALAGKARERKSATTWAYVLLMSFSHLTIKPSRDHVLPVALCTSN